MLLLLASQCSESLGIMPTMDDLSDDTVARILSNEAKKSSSRYSLDGLQAFLPKRFVPVQTLTICTKGKIID